MEDSKKSNKISDIVKLQLLLKKWRRIASNSSKTTTKNNGNGNKSIKLLKRTLSLSKNSGHIPTTGVSNESIPKGYLAVCVGEELKRFLIPTGYLGHPAFGILLREAEEKFGFHQEGILRIPCNVIVFEAILKIIERKEDDGLWFTDSSLRFCSSESSQMLPQDHYHPQSPMCR